MQETLKITKMLFSTISVIFLCQLAFVDSSRRSVFLIEAAHSSALKPLLEQLNKLLSFAVPSLLAILFFGAAFVVKPNVVENTVTIIFVCSSFFLVSFVKILTAELRPFMLSKLQKLGAIHIFDCESDFGNPSTQVFVILVLYFLFKVAMFDAKRHIVLSKDPNQEYEDENYLQNFFTFDRNYFILSEYCPFYQFKIPLSLFNTVFIAYIVLVAFVRFLSGS